MSRILRRPMFRGGRVDARGTGITSNLGYNNGGRVGLKNGGGYKFSETGFGKTLGVLNPKPAIYDLLNTLVNQGSRFFTGYNPGWSYNKMLRAERDLKDQVMGRDHLQREDRMSDDEVDYTNFFFTKPSAEKGSSSLNVLSIISSESGLVPLIEPMSIGLGKKSTTASNSG